MTIEETIVSAKGMQEVSKFAFPRRICVLTNSTYDFTSRNENALFTVTKKKKKKVSTLQLYKNGTPRIYIGIYVH